MTQRDGNGWIACGLGHRHWGRHGAAGLLAYAPDGAGRTVVLLQRRAWWTASGGTWGTPGGARDSHESPREAALREAAEECLLPSAAVRITGIVHDDHDGWSYQTLLGHAGAPFPVQPASAETSEVTWIPVTEVNERNLHPGFAEQWPVIARALEPVTIIVDGANVVGARADGWWRDRAGAAARLHGELSALSARGLTALPEALDLPRLDRWFPEFILVVEGAARAMTRRLGSAPEGAGRRAAAPAAGPGAAARVPRRGAARPDAPRSGAPGPDARGMDAAAADAAGLDAAGLDAAGLDAGGLDAGGPDVAVVAAGGSGDDTIADLAGRVPGRRLVVTADRELRRRCEAAGAAVTGPRWLLSLL
jgi:8-oxo-dGTP pyrophosphatase MutT (NUDIX family)